MTRWHNANASQGNGNPQAARKRSRTVSQRLDASHPQLTPQENAYTTAHNAIVDTMLGASKHNLSHRTCISTTVHALLTAAIESGTDLSVTIQGAMDGTTTGSITTDINRAEARHEVIRSILEWISKTIPNTNKPHADNNTTHTAAGAEQAVDQTGSTAARSPRRRRPHRYRADAQQAWRLS